MKRIVNKENEIKNIKELFTKKPSAGIVITIAAVLLVSLTAFFTLLHESSAVAEPQNITTIQTTSVTTARTTKTKTTKMVQTTSTTNKAADSYLEFLNIPNNFVNITYPDPSVTEKENSVGYKDSESSEIIAEIKKLLELLPEKQSSKIDFGAGKIYTLDFNEALMKIFKPENGQKTIVKISVHNNIDNTNNDRYYVCDASFFDKTADILKPYTIDAAKREAENFFNALSLKDKTSFNSYLNTYNELSGWPFLKDGTVSDLSYKLIRKESGKSIFKVTFTADGTDCKPFKKGKNERILEVGNGFGLPKIISFIDANIYKQPKTEEEKMCLSFATFISNEDFKSVSELSTETMLSFILGDKSGATTVFEPSYNAEHPSANTQHEFTRQEVERLAKSYFGVDHLDGTHMNFYHINGNYYDIIGYRERSNCYILRSEYNGNQCSVFVAVFKNSLKAMIDHTVRFDLEKNKDGTYRFLRAVSE